MRYSLLLKTISIALMVSCGNHDKKEEETMTEEKTFQEGSFGYDLQFLKEKDENSVIGTVKFHLTNDDAKKLDHFITIDK